MALNIKNRAAEQLAHEVAGLTGESLTEAVTNALRERLASLGARHEVAGLLAAVAELQDLVRGAPTRDARSAEEVLGYDDFGLPG